MTAGISVVDTKQRTYRDLGEYEQVQGARSGAFAAAGWKGGIARSSKIEFLRQGFEFITDTGYRFRFSDGKKPHYMSANGYKSCWYRLDEALRIAAETKQYLVLCNGESSTVTAQSWGIAATAVTAKEGGQIPDDLLTELLTKYSGTILIAADCDEKDQGKYAAITRARQLRAHGVDVHILDLNGSQGFDLGNFAGLFKEDTLEALSKLDYIEIPPDETRAVYIAGEGETEEQRNRIEELKEALKEHIIDFADSCIGNDGVYLSGRNDTRLGGNGAFDVDVEQGVFIIRATGQGGDLLDLIDYCLCSGQERESWDNVDMRSDATRLRRALHKASELTDIPLLERQTREIIKVPALDAITKQDDITEVRVLSRITAQHIREAFTMHNYTFRLNLCGNKIEMNGKRMDDIQYRVLLHKLDEQGITGAERIKNAFTTLADTNAYHPIKEYLTRLVWDGTDYIAQLANCFDDASGERTNHLWIKRWLVGVVAKVLDQKQSMMLVIEGPQGCGKSSFAQWLGSAVPAYYHTGPIRPESEDDQRRLAEVWVWECGELGQTTRRQDVEALKDFITRPQAKYRKKYDIYDTDVPAMASFIGTVNNDGAGFLVDSTGNRRFMVMPISGIDFSYTRIDVHQVWAQAVKLYRAGEPYQPTTEERRLQNAVNAEYEVDDPVLLAFADHFEIVHEDVFIPSSDILKKLKDHGVSVGGDKALAMGISRIVKKLGGKNKTKNNIRGYMGVKAKMRKGGFGAHAL